MEEPQRQQDRPPVAPLKVPPRATRSVSFSHSVFSPSPSPFPPSSFPSPSPTPRPRPRPPEAPAWFLLLVFHTLPLYVAHSWLSAHSSSSSPSTTVIFAFLVLLASSISFALLQEKQARTLRRSSIATSQWILLAANGLLLALSVFLKLEAVRSCGPLIAILGHYAGSVLGRLVLGKNAKRKTLRGVLLTVLGLVLLSQGWTVESCSPLAIKDRLRILMPPSSGKVAAAETSRSSCGNRPVWKPILSGLLSYVVQLVSTRTSLRMITKKRVHGLSSICATLLILPLALLQLESFFVAHASALWPAGSMLVLGLARSIMGDFYFEDRLQMPAGTSRHLFITFSCACLLELVFGLDISPLGFLACSAIFFFAVRESSGTSPSFTWDSIAEKEASESFVKGPLRYIAADRKSRKIAFFLAMNATFMVVEFVSGFMSNSLGLVSDACHMLFDCAALGIGLYASYISKLQPNAVFGYGYGRFEVLSGYANAVLLVLVGSLIVLESIERILDPPEISTEKLLLVSVGGLLVNLVGLVFFHDEHHHAHHPHSHGQHHCDHGHSQKKLSRELSIKLEVEEEHHYHHMDSSQEHHQEHQHSTDTGHEHHSSHHSHDDHNHEDGDKQHSPGSETPDQSRHEETCSHHHHHHRHEANHVHNHLDGHHQHDHRKEEDEQHENEHDHHHHHHHHHIDHNMRGIFLHVLADTLGSVGVVISTVLIQYKGWMLTDPACSIFISAMIIVSAVPLLTNSAEILLQRTPRSVEKRLHEALERIRHVEGVAGFERMHVWSCTNSEIVGSLHLHAYTADKNGVRDKVARLLNKAGITDLTVQVESI
ncbi:zinc transporter 5 [Selaginella moellendorffii]|uniref:zinc transporter 5 n=1 Tax=Selaginella moellendorffii TaxID=88036 RepID=UPI000D1C8563|nr:zinc transporter 5 [Selaginella moellendorffii]|eukprot:XP_024535859.1 zinc transporter 5 [Selaginella moellendorffii]